MHHRHTFWKPNYFHSANQNLESTSLECLKQPISDEQYSPVVLKISVLPLCWAQIGFHAVWQKSSLWKTLKKSCKSENLYCKDYNRLVT